MLKASRSIYDGQIVIANGLVHDAAKKIVDKTVAPRPFRLAHDKKIITPFLQENLEDLGLKKRLLVSIR